MRRIEETRGIKLDLQTLTLDDPQTYTLLASGNSTGIFQLESGGMRAILKELKPTCFEDIIAVLALYRPGPMEQIPEFIRRKHGGDITYLHPKMEPILKSTYGDYRLSGTSYANSSGYWWLFSGESGFTAPSDGEKEKRNPWKRNVKTLFMVCKIRMEPGLSRERYGSE